MSLKGCFGCLKFLVFVVNFLFWLIGLGVIAVSLWLLFDQQLYLQNVGAHQSDYYVGTYIILAVGSIMTIVGFLGCCGAWKENCALLATFFVLLVLIFVGEMALGVLIYLNEAPFQDVIRRSVAVTVTKKYHKNSTATMQTFDLIQEGLECCGAEGPSDWSRSMFNGHRDVAVREIGITGSDVGFGLADFAIPRSCCKRPDTHECLSDTDNVSSATLAQKQIFQQGCSDALVSFAESHVVYLVGMAGAVLLVQTLGLVFSMCLCCTIRKIEDLKN